MKTPRVAFVGWNPFQFLHFAPLVSRFPEATLIHEKRRSPWQESQLAALCPSARIVTCDRRTMEKLDGQFDVLVCQTPFHGIWNIRQSRIAMLQYGYAKEAHNYGAWRSFADVCMTYGPYASRKLEPFCPTVATGNPRFADWTNGALHKRACAKFAGHLDPAKKTLLYAPTWGPLSSHEAFSDAILTLASDYNLVLKIHHNTQRLAPRTLASLRQKTGVVHGADDDIAELLAVSDGLLSDFSGAIFDAIQCEIPVVLLGGSAPDSTSDAFSIEQADREKLGEVALQADELPAAVSRALAKPHPRAAELSALREDLFCDATGAADRATDVILRLAQGDYGPSQSQSYIRKEMAELHRRRAESRWLRQLGHLFRPRR